MPLLLLNNYKLIAYAVIASMVALLLMWVYLLKADLKVEIALKEGVISALTAQSTIIESNRVDYERNLAEANQTKTVIQTRHKERVKVIYQLGDTNASCSDSMQFINHYTF